MKHALILRAKARKDLVQADAWYGSRSEGLGDRFLLKVQRCLGYIAANPGGFQHVFSSYRQAPVEGFPYVVIYRLDGAMVVVLRIFHTSQHPTKKFRRKK
jgi:plasmid stabilization system protein ParE